MMLLRKLFVLLIALTVSDTTGAAKSQQTRVPAGHDSEIYCKACVSLVGNLEEGLLPKLEKRSPVAPGRSRPGLGEMDEIIEDKVENACRWASTHHDPHIRKSCNRIVTDYQEQIVTVISDWAAATPRQNTSELLPRICSKAVKACKSSDLKRNKPELKKEGYKSERPTPGQTGAVMKLVASEFQEVVSDVEKDVIVFIASKGKWDKPNLVYNQLWPRFEQAAKLLHQKSSTLTFCKIDGDMNEIPPPYGLHVQLNSISVYAANKDLKFNPSLLNNGEDGDITLHDFLNFMLQAVRSPKAYNAVVTVMNELGDKGMHEYFDKQEL